MNSCDRARDLFERAVSLPGPGRAALLGEIRAESPAMYDLVAGLLAEHDARDTRSPDGLDEMVTPASPQLLAGGAVIDRYTIRGLLGRGGMGEVYLADQASPRRAVALKLIRADLANHRLRRRFELESEVLGRLRHPGIAQVYEAGLATLAHGEQPYFAMEYVEGSPLTEYADANGLDASDRLRMIAMVADAIQHAHEQGVIHRDLKPGNILVTAEGQTKVLDFGVARATDCDIRTTTLETRVGQLVGTVPYMSPEQAAGDPAALDLRSDVYSLGVIAFELLAGQLPYELHDRLLHDALRVIQEDEPARLSTYSRTMKGDVETIIGKALEKEKSRRYQSAAELARDIRRSLNNEPISARPPSAWYQIRKFSRRHKALVGGTATTFLVLIAGIIATSIALSRALDAERLAEQRATETSRQFEETQAILDFVTSDILGAAAPSLEPGKGRQATLYDALTAASKRLDAATAPGGPLHARPHVEATVRSTIANSYLMLGEPREAEPHLVRSIAIRSELLGRNDVMVLRDRNSLGSVYFQYGEFRRALRHYEELLPLIVESLGRSHRMASNVRNNMALCHTNLGEPELAIGIYQDVLRELAGEDSDEGTMIDRVDTMGNLAQAHLRLGETDEAARLFRQAAEMAKQRFGPAHPAGVQARMNLLALRVDQGDSSDAMINELERLLDDVQRAYGPTSDFAASVQHNLGEVLRNAERLEEALDRLTIALELRSAILGADHPLTLQSQSSLALVYWANKDFEEAETLLDHAVRTLRADPELAEERLVAPLKNRGVVLLQMGDGSRANASFLEAVDILARGGPSDRRRALDLADDLAQTFDQMGHPLIALQWRLKSGQLKLDAGAVAISPQPTGG